MNILEKWPAGSWHIVPRKDGALSNIYCGGSPVALCVPDELSHMLKAAPAMLAALRLYEKVRNTVGNGLTFADVDRIVREAIERAEGRCNPPLTL